jgi:hypothetical protein
MSHNDREFEYKRETRDVNDDRFEGPFRDGTSQVELDTMTDRDQPGQGIHEPRHGDDGEQDMEGGDEEYRTVEEALHGMEGSHVEDHMSLAEAEAARGEGEVPEDSRQHDEDHDHGLVRV